MSAPLFPLGQILATPGALATAGCTLYLADLIARHVGGDWGCITPDDAALNQSAVAEGGRIVSAYPIDPQKSCAGFGENCLWIITEADRAVTTILLPSEY